MLDGFACVRVQVQQPLPLRLDTATHFVFDIRARSQFER
jgi:hypothetical protein